MQDGVERAVRVDEVVIATGTTPEIHDLGLDKAGVEIGRKGIVVDEEGRTSQKHIFFAAGRDWPHVTRTYPYVVRLGRSEDECLRSDEQVKGRIERFADGRGFVKTLTDTKGLLRGVTFVGARAEIFDWMLLHRQEPGVKALLDESVGV
jgi:pyruvate/2-oxoglutarate dehydrogenase complex dihydrolipoamide dehydrogenase (E3) component